MDRDVEEGGDRQGGQGTGVGRRDRVAPRVAEGHLSQGTVRLALRDDLPLEHEGTPGNQPVPQPGGPGTEDDPAVLAEPAPRRYGAPVLRVGRVRNGLPDLRLHDPERVRVAPAPDGHADLGGGRREIEAAADGSADRPRAALRHRSGDPVSVRVDRGPRQSRDAAEIDLGLILRAECDTDRREVPDARTSLGSSADHVCVELIPAVADQTLEREDDPRPAIPVANRMARIGRLCSARVRSRRVGREGVSFGHRLRQISQDRSVAGRVRSSWRIPQYGTHHSANAIKFDKLCDDSFILGYRASIFATILYKFSLI